MLKIMLIIVIFTLCTTVGFIYGDSFRKRYQHLKESYKGITILQNHVVYNNTPLPEAFEDVSHKMKEPMAELLSAVSNRLSKGADGDVYSNFCEVYKNVESDFYFEKEDKSILEDFLKSLGDSGIYGQEKIFRLTLENLRVNIDEASELAKKNTKLYRYLGISFGAMISIFLL
jgi:stage III sporulation protein AB